MISSLLKLGRRVAKFFHMKDHGKSKTFTQKYLYLADEEKILFGMNGKGKITQYVDGQGIDEHLGSHKK
ncbi:MAG: hypothetical protein PHY93_14255 [Bacteriovorax sp.]|nr:hypothetical protein [Bacteriovorax sp.]